MEIGSMILTGILCIGFLLHLAGIYCCYKEKQKLKNQKIILINLSAVEMVTIIFMMVHMLLDHTEIDEKNVEMANKVLCTIYHGLTNLFYLTMIQIPLDRLLCILWPTFYYVNVRVSTVKKTVLIIWTSSLLAPTPIPFLEDLQTQMKIILYSSYVAQAIFLVISITAYTLVTRHQIRRRKLFAGPPTKTENSMKCHRTYSVPFVLNASFVVFYIIPNFVSLCDSNDQDIFMKGLSYVGLIADPILYILLHKDIWPIVKKLFTTNYRLMRGKRANEPNEEIHLNVISKESFRETVC